MLKVLLKKQLLEVFKSYFYDAKHNKMRSKGGIVGYIIFFIVVMVGFLGGMFTMMALGLCAGLTQAGMGWLYFLLMGMIAIALGAFGSVFNTYSGLYLAKDNDLLLSMPIPVRHIITARLMNVFLLGSMYAATAFVPALIVYWVVAGATAANVVCGVLMYLVVAAIVLILSCLLGWVVAKISLRLKNKSFITVFISLVFVGVYYFFYFKARVLIADMVAHAGEYGAKIRGAANGLYLFGRMGEGDWTATALFLVGTAAVFALVCYLLARSFLKIATASGNSAKVRYTEKRAKQKSPFGAFLGKEFARFTSSPNYMLNCGLGILLIPACGVLLLLKGQELLAAVGTVFSEKPDAAAVLLCMALCLLSSMNDSAAPSVSLEGKALWIAQSLPAQGKTVLRAKTAAQLILSGIPMLVACVCAVLVIDASAAAKALIFGMPLVYAAFSAVVCTIIGVRMPILNWTNEIVPIKQSGGVLIAIFGSWAVVAVMSIGYLAVGWRIGGAVFSVEGLTQATGRQELAHRRRGVSAGLDRAARRRHAAAAALAGHEGRRGLRGAVTTVFNAKSAHPFPGCALLRCHSYSFSPIASFTAL